MATRTTAKRGRADRKLPRASKKDVQEALEVTWTLKGHLKNAQVAYIRVGALLARVRDEQLFAKLRHADLESYARERLGLRRAALYRYLQVYDWIAAFHPSWLAPRPKGLIPELSDVTDLIWIERELAREDLTPQKRAALEDFRAKALNGRLREGELAAWRRQGRKPAQALRAFLARVRFLRMRGSSLERLPAEAITHLDAAIAIIQGALAEQRLEFPAHKLRRMRRSA